MLDKATQYLQRIMHGLGPQIDAGLPIVVLEPSCASVFRDELRNLFPDNARAIALAARHFSSVNFWNIMPPAINRRNFIEKLSFTVTVITKRS